MKKDDKSDDQSTRLEVDKKINRFLIIISFLVWVFVVLFFLFLLFLNFPVKSFDFLFAPVSMIGFAVTTFAFIDYVSIRYYQKAFWRIIVDVEI